ncbi:MAG TPA: YncE family protein [Bacteroidetes bacterium]|nr:YncE family protein [Bacteroidota bacterium]
MKRLFILFIAVAIMAVSCKKDNNNTPDNSLGDGVFVLNQGNFNSANASLSYFKPSGNTITNDLFFSVNHVPLGDVAQSITSLGNTSYLVVNNSGLVYVIDNRTAKVLGSITGLSSPRYMLLINENKAYITDLYSTGITIINPSTYEITGTVDVGRTTEEIVMVGNKAFAANWSAFGQTVKNNKILVVDTQQDVFVDSIQVGVEPNSLVVDKDNNVWVLCSGGYDNEEYPTLWKIDALTHQTVDTLTFAKLKSSPDNLNINGTGDMLYFLNKGVYQFSIDSTALPAEPFIKEQSNRHFSYLGIDPVSGDIYASDPLDYQLNGFIYRFKENGITLSKNEAGIVPGAFGFNYH